MENIVKTNIEEEDVQPTINETSFYSLIEESKIGDSNYTKIPMSRLAAMGTAFQPVVTAIQTTVNGAGGSGIYFVDTAGKSMFQMKGVNKFIGSLKNSSGAVGGGQAQMTPLACDPTMIFMAAALANIDKKLDDIKEMQQEMMNFLIQKEKAEMKGNLIFLFDVINNYKFNWNNAIYKSNSHVKVLDIRQESEKKISFYREQIIAKVNKKTFIHSDQIVNKQILQVQEHFKDYQLALYLLSFSSFVEIMLLENFDRDYLNSITQKIETYSLKYRELYTQCYNEIFGYSSTSVQSVLLKGLSKTSTAMGKMIEKIPVVSNAQADETLIAAGDKLRRIGEDKVQKQMYTIIEQQNNYVRMFIDNINMINELHNNPVRLLIDKDNLHIATIA